MRYLVSLLMAYAAFGLTEAGEANPILPFGVTMGGQKADGSNLDIAYCPIARPVRADDEVVVGLPKVDRLLVNIFTVKADDWPEDNPVAVIKSTGTNRFHLNDAKDTKPLGDGYYHMQLLANDAVALIRFHIGEPKPAAKPAVETAGAKKPEATDKKPEAVAKKPAVTDRKPEVPVETAQAQPKEPAQPAAEPAKPPAPEAQPQEQPAAAEPDDVYLVNVDGMVWKNGKRNAALSAPVKIQARGLAGSPKLTLLLLLHADGNIYDEKGASGYAVPIRPIQATGIVIVGMEPYVLEGPKGQIWRYFREGPGKGQTEREQSTSRALPGPCVDFAIKGPLEDRAKRTVYILGADSRVYANGKPTDGLSPAVGLNKPQAITVDGEDVYVLDGSNGKVYKNGQHAPDLSPSVFIPCVDLAVRNGQCYILTPNGGVLVNGKKDPKFSSDVTSQFVGMYVGRIKAK